MKRIYFFCSLLLSLLLTSCGDYDDSAIQNKLNDFKERITALQTKANKLNEDISKLSYLTEGNVITSVTRNSDGQYVITYKDSNNEEKAVVVATQEDVIEAPILGVRLSDCIIGLQPLTMKQTGSLMMPGKKSQSAAIPPKWG